MKNTIGTKPGSEQRDAEPQAETQPKQQQAITFTPQQALQIQREARANFHGTSAFLNHFSH